MFNFDKEYNCLKFDTSYFLRDISFESGINRIELEKEVIIEFNGYISVSGDWDEYKMAKFDFDEDGNRCVEYLNGLLVLNKLMGE